jgi:OOP family OmpA-OmpF porin
MRLNSRALALVLVFSAITLPAPADAQLGRLGRVAREAAESEAGSIVDRLVRDAIRCAVDDPACVKEAEESGDDVIFVGGDGEVITDDEGKPITDREAALSASGTSPAPGEGAWANYDFIPGDEILFYEDFTDDRVGDFPRRIEFASGNWEIVEWEGRRLLRNTGPRSSAIKVPLATELPSRFTIEIEAYFPHGNQQMAITTAAPAQGQGWANVPGNTTRIGAGGSTTGVVSSVQGGTESTNNTPELTERLMPIRIMVDDQYAKMYVAERRVANIPNGEFARGDFVYFENTYFADEEYPMLLASIRIAAGGADLYNRLEADGRVATQGILFATNSDRIRPESTPTLEEIGEMMADHPDLRIAIEGHTDSDGDETHNQDLSERRAAAVKQFLAERHGVDPSRLETAGFGESSPVADNASPEGKQQNRRVELVRLAEGGQ